MRAQLLALALAMLAPAPRAAGRDDFRVVVNVANPVTALPRKTVAEIFLKKLITWPGGGGTISAVEPPDRSPTREGFCQAIHGKSATALRMHWTRVMFAGDDAPPVTRPTDADVLEYVRATPGAIGYVSASAPLGPGVKPIQVER